MGIVKDSIYALGSINKSLTRLNRTIFPYYHLVADHPVPHISSLYTFKNHQAFEKDLDFLLSEYQVLDPSEWIRKSLNQESIPSGSFLLSFDDGLSQVNDTIAPILKRKGIPAIFFVNNRYIGNNEMLYKHKQSLILQTIRSADTLLIDKLKNHLELGSNEKVDFKGYITGLSFKESDKLDTLLNLIEIDTKEYLSKKKPYMTVSDLRKLLDDGFYIGAHTTSHFPLDELTFDQQMEEIESSIDWVTSTISVDYRLFSFPFSDKPLTKKLYEALINKYHDLVLMGNSGFRKDISGRITHRISFENPKYQAEEMVRTNILYYYFLKMTARGQIRRK